MKTKMIAAMAVLALAIAGVAVLAEGNGSDAADAYTVSYKVGDRTFINTSETATITLATLAELGATVPEPGVEFAVWADGVNKYAAGSTLIIPAGEDKVELTANFKPITYKTEFIVDGKTVKEVSGALKEVADDGVTITPADPISLPAALADVDVSKKGYIFAGWMTAGAEEPIATADLGNLAGSVIYIAAYDVDYKVTFIDGDKTYISCVSNLVVPDLGEKTGFEFIGWFIGDVKEDPETYEYIADTTFEAKWEAKNCYVTFMAGETVIAKTPVLYGDKVVEPKVPEGYAKWDFDFNTPIKKDITIKALPFTYAVKFIAGDKTIKEMTVDKGTVLKAEDAPATVEGYLPWTVPTDPITKDTTINAEKIPAPAPTGLDDPIIKTGVIFGGILAAIILALVAMKFKKGDWVIGRAKKTETKE